MTEAIIINDQQLAIICDLVDGWGAKWGGKLDDNKRQALDQLIAKGFVELADAGRLRDTNIRPSFTSGRTLRWNKRWLNKPRKIKPLIGRGVVANPPPQWWLTARYLLGHARRSGALKRFSAAPGAASVQVIDFISR
jgi:hypothetical protein